MSATRPRETAATAAQPRSAAAAPGDVLRVALLGAGTVGREVVRGLLEQGDRLTAAAGGVELRPVGIAVRDVEAAAARGLPRDLLTDAPAHLVASPETDVVVELLGGDEPARTLVAAALSAGKAVVTANKHVVAHHGPELERRAADTGAVLRFEAAVAGGVPVLGPLASDLAANRVTRVRGIVNGTTNYILTAMAEGRGTYDDVLRDAQARGYAEADPSGDVEGRDAINKLVILARLGFGGWLDPGTVGDRPATVRGTGRPGITGVTADELAAASALGLTIRLLASVDDAGSARVVPTAVPADSAIGRTRGVRNRVEVRGDPVGDVGFDGPGAGGEATSSAVLGDLVAVARGAGSTWGARPPAPSSRVLSDDATARSWFTLLPGLPRDALRDLPVAAASEVAAGVAVRTNLLRLGAARELLARVTPDQVDYAIYPVDD